MSGSVNTGAIGAYGLEYWYVDAAGNTGNVVTRTVTVTDQTPPSITLNGSGTVVVEAGDVYVEQ